MYAENNRIFSKLKCGKWPKFDKIIEILKHMVNSKINSEDLIKYDVDYIEAQKLTIKKAS